MEGSRGLFDRKRDAFPKRYLDYEPTIEGCELVVHPQIHNQECLDGSNEARTESLGDRLLTAAITPPVIAFFLYLRAKDTAATFLKRVLQR